MVYLKKTNFPKVQRGSNIFPGEGGVQLFPGGRGGSNANFPPGSGHEFGCCWITDCINYITLVYFFNIKRHNTVNCMWPRLYCITPLEIECNYKTRLVSL